MFFVFGEQIVPKVMEEGSFECPVCGCRQDYLHIQEKSYFTLMFIRTFPLTVRADYLLCKQCENSFDPDNKSQAAFVSGIQMAFAFLISQYSADEATIVARDVHQSFCGIEWAANELKAALSAIYDWSSFQKRIKQHSAFVNYQGRLKVIEACLNLLHSVSHMTHDDRVLINMIGSALEVDPQDTQNIAYRVAQNIS